MRRTRSRISGWRRTLKISGTAKGASGDSPSFYVRYTGGEGIIDVLRCTPGPFVAVTDLDSVVSFT